MAKCSIDRLPVELLAALHDFYSILGGFSFTDADAARLLDFLPQWSTLLLPNSFAAFARQCLCSCSSIWLALPFFWRCLGQKSRCPLPTLRIQHPLPPTSVSGQRRQLSTARDTAPQRSMFAAVSSWTRQSCNSRPAPTHSNQDLCVRLYNAPCFI